MDRTLAPALPRPVWPRVRRALRNTLYTLLGLLLTGALTLAGLFAYYDRDLPPVEALLRAQQPQTTRIVDRHDVVLAELFEERRTVVPEDQIPRDMVIAIMAAEDADFYRHTGLNYLGMVRALYVNVRRGTIAQGASTITQQLVKNLLRRPERTLRRKMQEVILARRLEEERSDRRKNQIMVLYLNTIAFGHGRNGVEEAARYYFGRHASELTLGECALLAGIPKSPVHYSPRNNLEAALRRRRWVLGQMVAKGFVTREAAAAAAEEPVRLAPAPEERGSLCPEAVDLVRQRLRALVGEDDLRRGGYTIRTTLDATLQRAARDAVARGLRQLDARHGYHGPLAPQGQRRPAGTGVVRPAEGPPPDGRLLPGHTYLGTVERVTDPDPATRGAGELLVRVGEVRGRVPFASAARYVGSATAPSGFAPVGAQVRVSVEQPGDQGTVGVMHLELGPQGALVALDPLQREVLALVGGYDAVPGMFDRATRAMRQPGSAFKPVVYSYALTSRRYTLASTLDPNPGCFGAGRRPWCPREAHAVPGILEPPLRLREALAQSRNMVAARLLESLGTDPVIDHAHRLGLRADLPRDLSLALGSGSVTPMELTNAYATFAAQGTYQDWELLLEVRDSAGHGVMLPPRPAPRSVLTPAEAWLVTSALESVIQRGTGRGARELRIPAAGKTGTTDRARDAWFVGYTQELVAGVWVGFDDRTPLGSGEEGARSAVPIWTSFMAAWVRQRHPRATEFPRPEGVNLARIDPRSGLLARPDAADAMDEFFLAGTEPHDLAPLDAGPTTDGSVGTAAADASAAEPDPEPSPPETPMVLPILAPDGA